MHSRLHHFCFAAQLKELWDSSTRSIRSVKLLNLYHKVIKVIWQCADLCGIVLFSYRPSLNQWGRVASVRFDGIWVWINEDELQAFGLMVYLTWRNCCYGELSLQENQIKMMLINLTFWLFLTSPLSRMRPKHPRGCGEDFSLLVFFFFSFL
jgi:hypothetical protein